MPGRWTKLHDWWMARASISHQALFQIHINICGSGEILCEFATEGAVQSGQDLRRLGSMRNLRSQRHLKHGGDESRREPVSGHVGNENAEVLIVDLNEIIEITSDGSHGTKARDNLEPRKLRQGMRKDGKLYLPGHLEFIVERKQLCGELRTALTK